MGDEAEEEEEDGFTSVKLSLSAVAKENRMRQALDEITLARVSKVMSICH
jgi:hypothetical protein